VARQLRPLRKGVTQRPQMALAYQDASWWVLVKLDSALVSTADGNSAAWYKRDPRLFRSLGWRSLILHRGCGGAGRGWPPSTAPRPRSSPRPSGGGRPSRPRSATRAAGRELGTDRHGRRAHGRRRPGS